MNVGDDEKSGVISTKSSTPSSGSSGKTPWSMETLEASEYLCPEDEADRNVADEKPKPWGRLFPLSSSFHSQDLINHDTTFGRSEDCDYPFKSPKNAADPKSCNSDYLMYSKTHFIIKRETMSTGCHTFLVDCSMNGTFVNGTIVGRNNKQLLLNNDEIALAVKKNKAFVYMDLTSSNDNEYPAEIRDRYTVSKLLGRGACGEVRLAFEKGTCAKFAIKVISKKTLSACDKTRMNAASQVMNEVRVMKALKHPCIVKVEDVIDTRDVLYIVLELMQGGELFDRVKTLGQLPERTSKLIFYQMVVAINYLHQQGISHRDLKPENILLAEEENETLIKVTDFGLSKFVDSSTMKTFCGTPNYLAPEIILTAGLGSYTQAVDCWSLGVILFICLGGYPPFTDERTDMSMKNQILNASYSFPKLYWNGISDDAINMIKHLLTVDPKKRMTLSEALNHPWLKDTDMLDTAHRLMFPDASNGSETPLWEKRTLRPQLKRQREESDETIDCDDEDGSFDKSQRKKLSLE